MSGGMSVGMNGGMSGGAKRGATRRRFLAISAAATLAPGAGLAASDRIDVRRWKGLALGAVAEITIRGPAARAERALIAARQSIRAAEALFSLYDSQSVLSRLNRDGSVRPPAPFRALLSICDDAHRATGGRFDPTVQPLWRALAEGGDAAAARRLIGWDRVDIGDPVRLGPRQALTFNGVAQGFATDMATAALAAEGFDETLVNIGEFRAGAGDWRVGVEDPDEGLVRTAALSRAAIATSSPAATMVGGAPHILHPDAGPIGGPDGAPPRWSTVSVEAREAAIADAASTAFCLMDVAEIEAAMPRLRGLARVTLVAKGGDVRVLSG